MINNIDTSSLYEQDYYLWLQETYQNLKNQDVYQLDWQHLMEEISVLGNEQRRKVDSYLRQLLIYLLLYQYGEAEKERCGKGWANEIDNFRFELQLLLKSQTLYNYFLQQIEDIYLKARKSAIKKSDLPTEIFPEKCLYTINNLLDTEFLP